MDDLSHLNDLQGVDLHLRSSREELAEVKRRLTDEGDLPKIRSQLERIETVLEDRSAKGRSAEREMERLSGLVSDLERRLYDGSVTNQREFDALSDQREHAVAERGQAEEGLLELMVEMDDLQGARERHLAAIEKMTRLRADEVSRLEVRESELSLGIADLEEVRQRSAAGLPGGWPWRRYAWAGLLKKSRGGRAVASLDGRVCGVCRVELPTGDLARARAGQELVQCNSCRRIIFTG